jgi:tRNA A37 threonylcarbamoyladenosine biosynthesis protein TsaE
MGDKMLVILHGNFGAGKAMHLNYLGELLGRSVTSVTCSNVTSPSNLL